MTKPRVASDPEATHNPNYLTPNLPNPAGGRGPAMYDRHLVAAIQMPHNHITPLTPNLPNHASEIRASSAFSKNKSYIFNRCHPIAVHVQKTMFYSFLFAKRD